MIAILDYGAVRVFRVVLMTCMIQRIRAQIVTSGTIFFFWNNFILLD